MPSSPSKRRRQSCQGKRRWSKTSASSHFPPVALRCKRLQLLPRYSDFGKDRKPLQAVQGGNADARDPAERPQPVPSKTALRLGQPASLRASDEFGRVLFAPFSAQGPLSFSRRRFTVAGYL